MNDITQRLEAYPVLDLEERAEVVTYVQAHPEWADRLAMAQELAALLDAAGPGDIAEHVVNERMGLDTDASMTDALASDPEFRAEADQIRARLDALAEEAEDAASKLKRLTGRTLDEPAPPRRGRLTVAEDRSTVQPARSSRSGRWIALATAVVVVATGGLYAASALSLSDRDRLADLGDLASYEPLNVRGSTEDAPSDRLDVALSAVREAERSVLGLFPRYDAEALDAVGDDLEGIIAEVDPRSAVSQEARLALGRIRFARGQDAEAARVLGSLVREGSYRGPEARRLLDAIRMGG